MPGSSMNGAPRLFAVTLSDEEGAAVVTMMRTYSSVARMTMAERRVILAIATRIERSVEGHDPLEVGHAG